MPSETRDTKRWLSDIHDHIAKAEGFVAGLSYESFKDDDLRIYPVVRCLEIIPEASRRLPEELKLRHPSIVTSMRTLQRTAYGSPSRTTSPRCMTW
jgi:uncharacterized protein with HEPN domain